MIIKILPKTANTCEANPPNRLKDSKIKAGSQKESPWPIAILWEVSLLFAFSATSKKTYWKRYARSPHQAINGPCSPSTCAKNPFTKILSLTSDRSPTHPLTNTYNFGTYRHHRHITLSAHFFGLTLFLCHGESFDAWPGDVQDAVIEAAREATRAQRQFAAAEDAEMLAKLDPAENAVISLSDAERAEFAAVVAPVIAAFKEKFGPELFEYFA